MKTSDLKQEFQAIFESEPERVFFSPGRINLIGEHTDYNGGHVFPCAITIGTYGVYKARTDKTVRMYSANIPDQGIVTFDVDDLTYRKEAGWTNYPKGMMDELVKAGYSFDHGFDLYVHGNMPDGAGLSSSASIELLTGIVLKSGFDLDISQLDLVKIGQKCENNYVGVNSGIMDQFAVGMGKKDQAILLDTNTMDYSYAPVKLGDYVIVIMNTNKRRELADSKYNERRSECEEALRRLQTKLDIKSLGDLTEDEFDEAAYLINDETLIKRARHAVFENQRAIRATKALAKDDLTTFGSLVTASHVSLHFDYEVTGKELDTLAETAWAQPGVLGARMTGAGFGGCGIALVKSDEVDNFKQNVGKVYRDTIGYDADFYIAEIADGPKELA
ncbi:galactokinase [Lactiplantibacillus mudanjiangensis]|uniref:Galactokinase n=1 Tax=Lactiplantibacillus mudanjiangensis TaxID=1296538 RepID=A0A660E2A8_9LACO|nr:galactokinase [Lactiplantibacillus mudanjiangensis]VDG21251.1 galactokinase [Lactobacillus plantarum JDM1] [Lactiplantibacillus mudanjiangensis]VDG22493.1 galactokinase [Lactobacillus plantarum JDM1] [Lactiplantibacillus mudanjiangensis]VDG26966.1 galactokinase [Lactobacillus plantarum JDM1] [Lactiplantibacillus mudanjiangensis]